MYGREQSIVDATGVQMEEGPVAAADVEVVRGAPVAAYQVAGGLVVTGKPESIRRWVDAAKQFARAQLAACVMAGFELMEAKRAGGFVQGGARVDGDGPSMTWEAFCTTEIGISSDTARNWMKMAEAVKPRLRKLTGIGELMRDILAKPIAELDVRQQLMLSDAVQKITDGKSQTDFLAELGLAKRPQGSAAKGGDTGGTSANASPNPDALRLVAEADWTAVAEKLRIARANFTVLDDGFLIAVSTAMEDSLRAVKEWLATPKSQRTAEMVQNLEASLS